MDVLHEYQKKKTLEEVYDRVQKLFGSQPDLLDEFKYFLPDNNVPPPQMQQVAQPLTTGRKGGKKGAKKGSDKGKAGRSYKRRSKDAAANQRGKQAPPQEKVRKVTYPAGSEKELALFDKIKVAVTKAQWQLILKAMNLFSLDIVNRTELLRMMEDILEEKAVEYIDRFKAVIGYDDWEEKQVQAKTRNNYYAFVSSVDFTTCKQVTPSYRALPNGIATPSCSGRTRLCESVLNDTTISIPTSAEDYTVKSTRKNVYEENLFKVEDERFELDILIENNASAIRALERIVRQAENTPTEEHHLITLKDHDVDILHIRSIARLYGEQAYEVIELLKKNPVRATPTILSRMRQKDEEWRRVKSDMRSSWRRTTEQNYHKALDNRSFYFKQDDKKRRHNKALLTELKDAHSILFGEGTSDDLAAQLAQSELLRNLKKQPSLYTYCIRFVFDDLSIHHQVYEIITRTAAAFFPAEELPKFHQFWQGFVHQFYNVPALEASANAMSSAASPSPSSSSPGPTNASSSSSSSSSPTSYSSSANSSSPSGDSDTTPSSSMVAADGDSSSPANAAVAVASAPACTRTFAKKEYFERDHNPLLINYPIIDTITYERKEYPMCQHGRSSKMFMCNPDFYSFFRLHQFLYSRLLKAKELAYAKRPKSIKTSKKKRPVPTTPEGRYERFGHILLRLLDGDMDSNRFEDECRTLLGAGSYILFTIDKLINQTLKHVQSLTSDEETIKVLSLYQYQRKLRAEKEAAFDADVAAQAGKSADDIKKERSEMQAQLARTYRADIEGLIGTDAVCQVEYFNDTTELGLGLLDYAEVEDVSIYESSSPIWSQFFVQYINTEAPAAFAAQKASEGDNKNNPFLLRNITKGPYLLPTPATGEAATAEPLAMKDVYSDQSLLVKIDPVQRRLAYYVGTEDVHCRVKSNVAERAAKRKTAYSNQKTKFDSWWASRFSALFPDTDPAVSPHGEASIIASMDI